MTRAGAALVPLATFLLAVLGAGGPMTARAAGDPWTNPFCGGLVSAIPWTVAVDEPAIGLSSDRYVLQLIANGKTNVAASVTLITTTDAYSVVIPRTDLRREGDTDTFYAPPVLVAFDKPVEVHYAFVDQIGVDGAAPAACPTVVQEVKPFAVDSAHPFDVPRMGGGVAPVAAKYLQALPPLPCGRSYIGPGTGRDGPLVGHYGNTPRTTVVRVYVDSNGTPMNPKIERSSGVEGLDAAALGGVQNSRFKPAQFLCTPVVSEMLIEMEYKP